MDGLAGILSYGYAAREMVGPYRPCIVRGGMVEGVVGGGVVVVACGGQNIVVVVERGRYIGRIGIPRQQQRVVGIGRDMDGARGNPTIDAYGRLRKHQRSHVRHTVSGGSPPIASIKG